MIVHNFDAPTTSEMKGKQWKLPLPLAGQEIIPTQHYGSRALSLKIAKTS